jgi:hypothetical protein
MRTLVPQAMGLVLVVLATALPASAQVAGPIEVSTNSFHATYPQGGFTDLGCETLNQTSDATVAVLIEGSVTYADGTTRRILGPTPATLEPGDATILFIASIIPLDAPLGDAVFECRVRVTAIRGGTNHGDYTNPLVAADTSPFEIIAP